MAEPAASSSACPGASVSRRGRAGRAARQFCARARGMHAVLWPSCLVGPSSPPRKRGGRAARIAGRARAVLDALQVCARCIPTAWLGGYVLCATAGCARAAQLVHNAWPGCQRSLGARGREEAMRRPRTRVGGHSRVHCLILGHTHTRGSPVRGNGRANGRQPARGRVASSGPHAFCPHRKHTRCTCSSAAWHALMRKLVRARAAARVQCECHHAMTPPY